jgi:hypothetical protein
MGATKLSHRWKAAPASGEVSQVGKIQPSIKSKESEMPIQLNREANGGRLLAVHVGGKLAKADYEHFVPRFEGLVKKHG